MQNALEYPLKYPDARTSRSSSKNAIKLEPCLIGVGAMSWFNKNSTTKKVSLSEDVGFKSLFEDGKLFIQPGKVLLPAECRLGNSLEAYLPCTCRDIWFSGAMVEAARWGQIYLFYQHSSDVRTASQRESKCRGHGLAERAGIKGEQKRTLYFSLWNIISSTLHDVPILPGRMQTTMLCNKFQGS